MEKTRKIPIANMPLEQNREAGSLIRMEDQFRQDLQIRRNVSLTTRQPLTIKKLWQNSPLTVKATTTLLPLIWLLGKHPRVTLLMFAVCIMAATSAWDWYKRGEK